jgi:hypothetical protein
MPALAPCPVWRVGDDQPVLGRLVGGRQPIGPACPERRIGHAERLEDPGPQNLGERLPGRAGEQHAEHMRARVYIHRAPGCAIRDWHAATRTVLRGAGAG